MGKDKFVAGLQKLGYEIQASDNNRVIINDYTIKEGRFSGCKIKLGFEVNNFEAEPPHGPHVSPKLIGIINTASQNHSERVHESPFGQEWEHLSRPYPGWEKTGRTVAVYMAYVRHLLETL